MGKIDQDVRSLFNYLYWHITYKQEDVAPFLICDDDTPVDADDYLEGDHLPKPSRELLLDVDSQMTNFPPEDFLFGYPLTDPMRTPGELRRCFVVMPYSPPWFGAVKTTIEAAAKRCSVEAKLSLDMSKPGCIIDQIWQEIRRAEVVVCDLSPEEAGGEGNPNVFYELGVAHALGKAVILITQESKPLPFDVKTSRRVPQYTTDEAGLAYLEKELVKSFQALPQRYRFDPRP